MRFREKMQTSTRKIRNETIVFLFPIGLNFFLINTVWTPTQGWYFEWASYIKEGMIPYRDFYLPFPPLYVWVNRLFLFAPDPLLAERIMMTVIYSLLSLGLYKFLTKFFSSQIAICAAILSILTFQFSPTNTIGGYFEFALLLASWGLYLVLSDDSMKRFIGGILLVGSSLTKQNFLILVFVVVILEIKVSLDKEKLHPKKYSVSLGVFVSYSTFMGYLLATDSLSRFIGIMLQGGGKNPNIISLLKNILAPSLIPSILFLFCLLVIILTQIKHETWIPSRENKYLMWFLVTQLVSLMLSPVSNLNEHRISIVMFLFFSIGIAVTWKFLLQQSLVKKPLLISTVIFITPVSMFISNEIYLRSISFDNSIFQSLVNYSSKVGISVTGLLLIIMNVFIIFQLSSVLVPRVRSILHGCFEDSKDHSVLLTKLNFILFGLIGAGLLNAINGGFEFAANLILGAVSLAYFIKIFEKSLKKNLFILIFTLYFMISSVQIGLYNYQWFGWNESVSGHSTTEKSNVPLFRNFFLSLPQKNFYQEIQSGIDSAEEAILDSREFDAKVLVFPMQPIVGRMSNLSNYRMNCPILHFDVCPDNEGQKDLQSIMENPPDLVILFDLGKQFVELNEQTWRDGQISTYRKTQNFFLKSGRYSVVKIIKPDSVNLSRVYILKLSDGKPKNE